jgi:hypothetical protein
MAADAVESLIETLTFCDGRGIGLRAATAGSPGRSPELALLALARYHQDDEGESAESSDTGV